VRRERTYRVVMVCDCGWQLDVRLVALDDINRPFGIIDACRLHALLAHHQQGVGDCRIKRSEIA
jgi:hypothetical protein